MRLLITIECTITQIDLLHKLVNPTGTLVTIKKNRVILDSSDLVHGSLDELETTKISYVWKRVRQFISEINGAAAIRLSSLMPLSLVNIQVVQSGGETIWLPITGSGELYDGMETVNATISAEETADITHITARFKRRHPAADLLIVASHDENVAKVLRLQEYKKDWTNLYRILEVIRDDIGGYEKIEKEGWATTNTISTFTGSANNPSVTGDDSRHGSQKGKPPRNTMKLSEAQRLIADITKHWLSHKVNRIAT